MNTGSVSSRQVLCEHPQLQTSRITLIECQELPTVVELSHEHSRPMISSAPLVNVGSLRLLLGLALTPTQKYGRLQVLCESNEPIKVETESTSAPADTDVPLGPNSLAMLLGSIEQSTSVKSSMMPN